MNRIAILLLILLVNLPAAADELADRKVIWGGAGESFLQEDFARLTALSEEYLTTQARTASGVWKLKLLYMGISLLADTKNHDEAYWDDLEQKARKWIAANPSSPTPYIAHAKIVRQRAWMYRGSGFAKDVSEEQSAKFQEHLAKAHEILIGSRQISQADPNWYSVMIDNLCDESQDGFQLVLDEGTQKFPFYYEIYHSAARYLQPRWHGEPTDLNRLAEYAVDRTSYKEGAGLYARIYWRAFTRNYVEDLLNTPYVNWTRMRSGMVDVVSVYPAQWNIRNFARLACIAGDAITASRFLSQMEPSADPSPWKSAWELQECRVLAQP